MVPEGPYQDGMPRCALNIGTTEGPIPCNLPHYHHVCVARVLSSATLSIRGSRGSLHYNVLGLMTCVECDRSESLIVTSLRNLCFY